MDRAKYAADIIFDTVKFVKLDRDPTCTRARALSNYLWSLEKKNLFDNVTYKTL